MGGHAMGPGFWLIKLVLNLTHYNPLSIAYLNVFIFFLATLCAVSLVKLLYRDLTWSDMLVPFLVLNLSQWGIYLEAPNPAHGPLSLFFLLLFLICLIAVRHEVLRLILCLVLGLFVVFSGYGLFLVFLLPFILGSNLFPKYRLIGVLGALGIAFLFFRSNEGDWHQSCVAYLESRPWEGIYFFTLVFGRSVGATRVLSLPSFVGIGLLATGIYVIFKNIKEFLFRRKLDPVQCTTLILSSFTFLFILGLAKGRSCMGRMYAFDSRYVPYVIPFLLAFYIEVRNRPLIRNSFLILFIAFDLWPKSIDQKSMAFYRDGKTAWLACYNASHDVERCNQDSIYIAYPNLAEGKIAEKMKKLEEYQQAASR
jgi:hypothetical protein